MRKKKFVDLLEHLRGYPPDEACVIGFDRRNLEGAHNRGGLQAKCGVANGQSDVSRPRPVFRARDHQNPEQHAICSGAIRYDERGTTLRRVAPGIVEWY